MERLLEIWEQIGAPVLTLIALAIAWQCGLSHWAWVRSWWGIVALGGVLIACVVGQFVVALVCEIVIGQRAMRQR